MKNSQLTLALRNSVSIRSLIIALSAPLLAIAPLSCANAGALPTSGQYAAGSGTIAKAGSSGLTINQSSNTGVINWNSFSIGSKNAVQFNNGNGATLNRVTGGDLSTISGSLKATGSVYLINPQGVIVSGSGKVLTGGTFVGSTRDMSDSDFASGKRQFSGTSNGNVSNAGTIVSANGDVALIGNAASNSGTLSAANGSASVNAGNNVLLAPAGGNGRVLVNGGNGDATNSGTIAAAQAQINAAGGNVYALGGNNGGIIRATGTATVGGHIWLTSGAGNTSIAGTVSAQNADGSGGTIESTGQALSVAADARINASGTRGGTILLGGDVHGGKVAPDNFAQDTLATAQTTTVAHGAKIKADASNGKGGNIVVWSDTSTGFAGDITATGSKGEQGGFAEVSSHDLLDYTGIADLTAFQGTTGTLLLDPQNVVISADGSKTDACTAGICTPTANDSILNISTLQTALATADVEVQTGGTGAQLGNISVVDPISWSSSHTLKLNASNTIYIAAPITITGTGGLDLEYGGLQPTIINGSGSVTFNNLAGTLIYNSVHYTLVNDLPTLISDIAATPSGIYALASNIEAPVTAYTSSPISTAFSGRLEGLGHSISDLKITDAVNNQVGLFSAIGNALVTDIDLINPTISATHNNAAVGALAGVNTGGDISWVRVIGGSVTGGNGGGSNIGGLVGENVHAITLSSVTAAVSGGDDVNIGGLVGNNLGSVSHSYASGAVTATINGVFAGGLAGESFGSVDSSYATGTVTTTGSGVVGGLVGFAGGGTVTSSYATGSVKSGLHAAVGGLVGNNQAAISNAYALGSVTGGGDDGSGDGSVGGLAGINSSGGSISGAYATGFVGATAGGDHIGGFVGNNAGAITGGYFDSDSPLSNSVGTGTATGLGLSTNSATATGLTTIQMMTSTNMPGMTFGTTPGAAGFVIVNPDGIHFNVSNGSTLPLLLAEATPNVQVINNAHQLQLISLDPTGTFFLGNNIDVSGAGTGKDVWEQAFGFVPIDGAPNEGLLGNFFGLHHAISNLYINNSAIEFAGLFLGVNSNTGSTELVENFSLINADIQSSSSIVGAVIGTVSNAIIRGVTASGTVTAPAVNGIVGGLVGRVFGNIVASHSSVTVVASNGQYVGGLVGFSSNSITSSSASGTVTAGDVSNVGGLAGIAEGTVTSSFATGAVTGGNHATVGGLLGDAAANTFSSYATGSVTGGNNSNVGGFAGDGNQNIEGSFATGSVKAGTSSIVGGFVAYNSEDAIEDYALGSVTAGAGSTVGGFAGENGGEIGQAYSTGFVSAAGAGGFIGTNDNTSANAITGSYWDTQTTGALPSIASGTPQAGVAGKTTAQMQAALPSAFDPADWAIIAGKSFSYLKWQVPSGTPEVVSGTIGGAPVNSGLTVDLLVNGHAVTALDNMPSGANGYYYELLAPGTISGSGSKVLAYIHGSTVKADTLEASTGGSVSGLNLFSGYLIDIDNAATLSSMEANYTSALGTSSGSDFLGFTHSLEIIDNAASFAFNTPLTLSGSLILKAGGAVTQTGAITTASLTGSSAGGLTLNGANQIATFGAFTNTEAGGVSLTDARSLTVSGAVNAGTGALALKTTGAGHNLSVTNVLTSTGTASLTSAGTIGESGSGKIAATTLLGSSVGGVTLNGANLVGAFDSFANTGGGNIALTNAQTLYVGGGGVNAGTGNVTLKTTGAGHNISLGNVVTGTTVDLLSAGTISEGGSGAVHATTLLGSSVGGTTLNGANLVGAFDSFTNTGGGTVALTDAQTLYVGGGGVNAGTGNVTLKTTGAGHNLSLGNVVTGVAVDLLSAGTLSEGGSGVVHATTLLGSSVGGTTLNGANLIGAFDSFTNTGGGNIALVDAQALYVGGGGVNAGTGNVTLTTTGAGHNLTVGNVVSAATAKLVSAGTISESGAGVIHATALLGSSVGGTTLNGANLIGALSNFANTGAGNFVLKDGEALTVNGAVSVASASGTLGLTTTAGNLIINGSLTGPIVTLITAGEALESSAGAITATSTLNVSAQTGINLNSTHNHIHAVGTRHTNSGPNVIAGIGM